jgi:hypothetical protein
VGDPSKKAFTYFVLTGGRFIYASAIRVTVLKFLMTMTVRASRAPTVELPLAAPDADPLPSPRQSPPPPSERRERVTS